jgi:phage terminase large subunit GpA-like protein
VDGRPFTLEGREYVQQIIRDYSPEIWCPKAAQMAYTVTAIVRSLHNVTERKWNGLYLLPLKTGAIPFVQARIDPIIESNPALAERFDSVDNRLHKQSTDKLNLYIRGTNISRELQEIPVDFEIWDERDRMVDENLEDARHRMDGSNVKQLLVLSTPTVDGHGVYADDAWPVTDKHRWEVPCPSCGRFQSLNFDDHELDYSNVRLGDDADDCAVECAFCHKEISDQVRMHHLNAQGRWSAHNLDGRLRGYYINQLNSPTQKINEIMKGFFEGQTEIRKLKAFWQQNMGKPYTAPGDRVTPKLLDDCREPGYHLGTVPSSSIFIGIDVGTLIHVWCWTIQRKKKYLWKIELFDSFDQLDRFLSQLTSWTGVIDAHPEKSKASAIWRSSITVVSSSALSRIVTNRLKLLTSIR